MPESPATLEYAFAAPVADDEPDAPLSSTAAIALWAAFTYVVACVMGLLIMGIVMALRV